MRTRTTFALALLFGLVLTACGGPDLVSEPAGTTSGDEPSTPTNVNQLDDLDDDASDPGAAVVEVVRLDVPSALDDRRNDDFPAPLIEIGQILSGGPPPDGIPPIDEPEFVDVASADSYLADQEPVVALEIAGDARAYPVQVLIWHEIVNDTVGGVPVAVTYCPLCNSAVTFERTVQDRVNSFGTSGSLYNSALVMYDRATESLWTHFDGRAVVGYLAGEQLEFVPSSLVSWAEFKAANPDGMVLDRDRTGHRRSYGTNPYQGYDDPGSSTYFPTTGSDLARAKQRVVGLTIGEMSKAWSLDVIAGSDRRVTAETFSGTDLAFFFNPGQASGVDTTEISEGRAVGTVKVFDRLLDGEILDFEATTDGYVDSQTGSVWNIFGEATEGPLAGSRLREIPHLDTFWCAWSSYRPGTEAVFN